MSRTNKVFTYYKVKQLMTIRRELEEHGRLVCTNEELQEYILDYINSCDEKFSSRYFNCKAPHDLMKKWVVDGQINYVGAFCKDLMKYLSEIEDDGEVW